MLFLYKKNFPNFYSNARVHNFFLANLKLNLIMVFSDNIGKKEQTFLLIAKKKLLNNILLIEIICIKNHYCSCALLLALSVFKKKLSRLFFIYI